MQRNYMPYETIEGSKPCIKRPVKVMAKQIDSYFRIEGLDGKMEEGNPGDYIVTSGFGPNIIVSKALFPKLYDFLTFSGEG